MYMILKKELSFNYEPTIISYFTEDIDEVARIAAKKQVRIYKLDNLQQLESIEVTYEEKFIEQSEEEPETPVA